MIEKNKARLFACQFSENILPMRPDAQDERKLAINRTFA